MYVVLVYIKNSLWPDDTSMSTSAFGICQIDPPKLVRKPYLLSLHSISLQLYLPFLRQLTVALQAFINGVMKLPPCPMVFVTVVFDQNFLKIKSDGVMKLPSMASVSSFFSVMKLPIFLL